MNIIKNNFTSSLSKSKIMINQNSQQLPPECDSLYCTGDLIDMVMSMRIFNDSKTFVDLKLKENQNVTMDSFNRFIEKYNKTKPPHDDLKAWLIENFEPVGSELMPWNPIDFKTNPELLNRIRDTNYKKFASDLNHLWIDLSRKMKDEVREHPELTSIIYVKNPFIIAGGRFREWYYWDSYWMIKGLLACEMYETVKGMIENFLSVVNDHGFIPNGGRIYYNQRSQPPLLSDMIKSYVDVTHNYDFAVAAVRLLEKEFNYFMSTKMVTVKGHRLARYIDGSRGPRPESYREDVEIGKWFETEAEREEFYAECKAAGESGMDFSSRWFITENGTNLGTLKDLKTRSVIPVELNAFLYSSAKTIAEFYGYANNDNKKREYEEKAHEIFTAINEVLWDEESGIWLDYDLINNKSRPYFTPTNFSPLWTNCYNKSRREIIADKIIAYVDQLKLDDYPGGVPNTLYNSGEQWDWPSVWPNMMHLIIFGLENLNDAKTSALALKWANRWVRSNYIAYVETGGMYEKYKATEFGAIGGGGEYAVQKGFGWSNGVVLDLLYHYGHVLDSSGWDSNLI